MSLENYEPVAVRIDKFWKTHPQGRIITDLVEFSGDRVIARAEIYTDREDPRPAAVDFALEVQGSSNVNRNFHLEACVTSAIGRALATLNFQGDPSKLGGDARPSREEMQKVQRTSAGQVTSNPGGGSYTIKEPGAPASDKQKGMIRAICKGLGKLPPPDLDQLTKDQASELITALKNEEDDFRANGPDQEEPF